jgi:hypothetical protein
MIGATMERNGTKISDEYAAACVDGRALVHLGEHPSMSLQLPQRDVAHALVEHWGCGEVESYQSPTNGRYYNNIVIREPDLARVLLSVRPYLIGKTRVYVDAYLRTNEEVA